MKCSVYNQAKTANRRRKIDILSGKSELASEVLHNDVVQHLVKVNEVPLKVSPTVHVCPDDKHE